MSCYRDNGRTEDRENDVRIADKTSDRRSRFVGDVSDMFKSKSLNDLRAFYNGDVLTDRMTEIRKSINHIRHNWDDFDSFLTSVKQLIDENKEEEFKDTTTKQYVEVLLTSKRDWMKDEEATPGSMAYEAIKVYTSDEGYSKIYSLSNDMFRSEESVSTPERIQMVTFLVELINIDLFNYCIVNKEKANFEGEVYRGLCLANEDIELYRSLRMQPIGKRYISVPLGLVSTSTSFKVAEDFIDKILKENAKADDNPKVPLLMRIHVIGLKPKYVEHYTKTFPSVLSTICAVDIHEISIYPTEHEVLLRGPFFVVLDISRDESLIRGQPCDVMDLLTVNANRDHISTSFLGDQDAKARDMFGTMVNVTRGEYALKFCRDRGLVDDAQQYQKLLEESSAKLEGLMKAS